MSSTRTEVEKMVGGYRGPLHSATQDLHHLIETSTHLGQVMATGTPSDYEYVGWLSMKAGLFALIEPHVPASCHRVALQYDDIAALGAVPMDIPAIANHARWMADCDKIEAERRITGTAYVCVGSTFGAAQIKARIVAQRPDLPVASLSPVNGRDERAYLAQLRHRADCIMQARYAFATLVHACNWVASEQP